MPHDQAYLQAEKKIKEAQHFGAKEINLSDMELSNLPESLEKFARLQSLNLSYNKLKKLPDWLGLLTRLQSLDLSHNQLVALPESFGNLKQLQRLSLVSNNIKELPKSLIGLTLLQRLILSSNKLTEVPEWLENLVQLQSLYLDNNQLTILPDWLGKLIQLQSLVLSGNQLSTLPESLSHLTKLQQLDLSRNQLEKSLPGWFGNFTELKILKPSSNRLNDIPATLNRLRYFDKVVYHDKSLEANPLNPELLAAYKNGLTAFKAYLSAKAIAQITLNEGKLIIIGEGEVGKTCLMDALLGKQWQEHPSTHGIEIQQVKVTDAGTKKEITLNGWDFGGQRVYRPTHQLFFSAPAVYLVVWKPREGPQQGFVKEWIQLVKRREPSAKIIVVVTHGGPQQRQPDIDRQENCGISSARKPSLTFSSWG